MIAIYGGSFNPPSIGHLGLLTQVLAHPSVTGVKVIPCFRQKGKTLETFEHRVHMARLAFGDLPCTYVDTIEGVLGGESYTYRTVEAVMKANPREEFALALGEDLRSKVDSWMHPERITIPKIFFPRTGTVSSTLIRMGLKSDAKLADTAAAFRMLQWSVASYIKDEGLYR